MGVFNHGAPRYEKFIARQPIFDEKLKVFAYELLFRSGPDNFFKPQKEPSSSVIVDSLPISPDTRAALCGGANRFRDIYETLIAYERADWPALATASASARLGPVESLISDCYTAATQRSAALVS